MSSSLAGSGAAAAFTPGAGGVETPTPYTLETLPFDNAAIRELPVDVEQRNYVRQVPDACFSKVAPDPVLRPVMVVKSDSALALLGLSKEQAERDDAPQYFSGEI